MLRYVIAQTLAAFFYCLCGILIGGAWEEIREGEVIIILMVGICAFVATFIVIANPHDIVIRLQNDLDNSRPKEELERVTEEYVIEVTEHELERQSNSARTAERARRLMELALELKKTGAVKLTDLKNMRAQLSNFAVYLAKDGAIMSLCDDRYRELLHDVVKNMDSREFPGPAGRQFYLWATEKPAQAETESPPEQDHSAA